MTKSGAIWSAVLLACATASAANLALRGKVVMEDGSIPIRKVGIERDCGNSPQHVATTNDRGEFFWNADVDTASSGLILSTGMMDAGPGVMANLANNGSCLLRATLAGYESNVVNLDDLNSFSDPVLPTFRLARRGTTANFDMLAGSGVPRGASRAWNRGVRAIRSKNFPDAERELRVAVQAAPRFAQGWNALATVYVFEKKSREARDAYQHAIAANPRLVQPYLLLARLDIADRDWPATLKTAEGLIRADTRGEYPEAYLYQAIARYQSQDLAGAEASASEAIRRDKRHEVPTAEYVYGLILEARREFAPAGEHMSKYLELAPKAADAEAVRTRIENLGKPGAAPVAIELQSVAANLQLTRTGDAWVPGGIKALAAAAHMTTAIASSDFFAEYCRAIVRETSLGTARGIPQYVETLRAFISTVTELSLVGRRENDRTVISFSLEGNPPRTTRILQLLGWKIAKGNSVEPGDQPSDGMAQKMPALLGIDEVKMQRTLNAGRAFQFEIVTENAPLIGGGSWTELLKDKTLGIAAAFATDPRLAKAYAGLGAMGLDAAAAVVAKLGLRRLVTEDADLLWRDSSAFALTGKSVATPGDPAAWQKLTGANPNDPPAFFRALLEKDAGSLADFYAALWRADAAHRKFFLENAARSYDWDQAAPRSWSAALFESLPLDENGHVQFPGGRKAWTGSSEPDAEALLKLDGLEALVPIAQVERTRGTKLDESSVRLLARHFQEWRALFPYFETLPALGSADFAALESFSAAAEKLSGAERNLALGQWDSLIELIARGAAAGSLRPAQSARAFRDTCLTLAQPVTPAKIVALLRTIAEGDDLDRAVPAGLLRLTGAKRAGYDRVLQLQKIPRISAARTTRDIATALAGMVYAASLDPDGLLVNEDPSLVSRHRFAGDTLFPPAALVRSTDGNGSYLTGGFANFGTVSKALASGGMSRFRAVTESASLTGDAAPADLDAAPVDGPTFRASGRLVEVYTTVTDSSGHYLDDLSRDQFSVSDNGAAQKIVAFEPRSSEVSVALLLDTTGSMYGALPALKNAALKLIGELRATDSVAVYSFNNTVRQIQPFSADQDAAKRAVLSAQAEGETALYDALTRVGRDLSARGGKKVIVVFTDGNDNASTLTSAASIERAKAAGIPVYTIAQGDALNHPEFLKQLAAISKATGAVSFAIHSPSEIGVVFEKVSADLTHGYLLVFQPAPVEDHAWRVIEVGLQRSKSYRIRARDGYYPE